VEGLGSYLRELRTARKLSRHRLARMAGISHSTLGTWESGTHLPRLPELEAVLTALDAAPAQRRRALASMDATRAARQLRLELATPTTDELGRMPSGGDLLRAMRLRKGHTQAEAATRAGVRQSTLARWEEGATWPETAHLHALCRALEAQEEEVCALTCGFFSTRNAPYAVFTTRERVEQGFWNYEYSPYTRPCLITFDLYLLALQAGAWPLAARDLSARTLYAQISARYALALADGERFAEATAQAYRALELAEGGWEDWALHAVFALARAQACRKGAPAPLRSIRLLCDWLPQARSPVYRAWAQSEVSKYMALLGETDGALAQIEDACESARRSGNENEFRVRTLDAVQILLRAKRPAQALVLLPAEEAEYPLTRARERLLRAETLLALEARSEAHDWLQRATELIAAHRLWEWDYITQADALTRRL
jgi:transcriptional regulator with XRE-family HTH domain